MSRDITGQELLNAYKAAEAEKGHGTITYYLLYAERKEMVILLFLSISNNIFTNMSMIFAVLYSN